MKLPSLTLIAALLAATPAHAVTIVTVEAAGLQWTTRTLAVSAVETFDAQPTGSVTPVSTSFAAIGVASAFTRTQITPADIYGGAGGTGNQVAVRNTGDLNIAFDGMALDYFGVWASALDARNTVSFYRGDMLLSSTDLTAFPLADAYRGNPTAVFAAANSGERYAFFNFQVTDGYDRVVLAQNGGGGFELDNLTIGATVPEAQTWAMLIIGFAMVGMAMRRRLPRVTT